MTGMIITIEKDELQQLIQEAVRNALPKKEGKQYLSRKEVASMLNITLPTLHGYVNDGLLIAEKIGGRTLFDAEKVQAAVKEKAVFRYRHNRRG